MFYFHIKGSDSACDVSGTIECTDPEISLVLLDLIFLGEKEAFENILIFS